MFTDKSQIADMEFIGPDPEELRKAVEFERALIDRLFSIAEKHLQQHYIRNQRLVICKPPESK